MAQTSKVRKEAKGRNETVSYLRYPFWANKAGSLNSGQSDVGKLVDELYLNFGWDDLLFVLKTISGSNFNDFDLIRCCS